MFRQKLGSLHVLLLIIGLVSVALSSCALFDLKDELEEVKQNYGLGGQIVNLPPDNPPVVVVLYKKADEGRINIMDYVVPDPAGFFAFIVPEGVYQITAFEDQNRSFSYDEGERFGYAAQGEPIHANAEETSASGQRVKGYDFELLRTSGYPKELPTIIDITSLSGKSWVKTGVVTTLDDPIFIQENGYLGYWKPLTFLRDVGAGIYLLEPYDPGKIPVLFVHGANGTPIGFGPIIEKMDRSRYQPWFYYYPSGFRIDAVAKLLNNLVTAMQKQHGFRNMIIAAHSMGGLVSRAFIIKNAIEDRHTYINKFIALSTPWGGVKTAQMGVEKSPIVSPNWIDVYPESEFIRNLYQFSLPNRIAFYMMFGIRGNCSMMMANNDGTIEISSEIDYRAQADAIQAFPFDEDHDSILASERVIDLFHKLLKGL